METKHMCDTAKQIKADQKSHELVNENMKAMSFAGKFQEEQKRSRLAEAHRYNKLVDRKIQRVVLALLVAFILFLAFTSCEQIELNEWTRTEIKQGEHFTVDHSEFMQKDRKIDSSLMFEFVFNASMSYQFKTVDSLDYNKLLGVSTSQIIADQNAIKIGWRWNKYESCFDVAVVYDFQGGRKFYELGQYNIGDTATFLFNFSKNKVNVMCENGETEIYFCKPFEYHFITNFYFGGNCTAPHSMNFKYKILRK